MKQAEFEAEVLSLWTKTRVPLSRANLMAHTKVPRAQMDKWLDEMVRERLLELDVDDDGNILWAVRGAARPARGLETVSAVEKKSELSKEVDKYKSSAKMALKAAGIETAPEKVGKAERKSLLASGLLSFFFGPLGFLYAAPLKEALPVILVYVLICAILPQFLLVYLIGPVNLASAVAGVLYAWSYNHEGRRAPLVLKG